MVDSSLLRQAADRGVTICFADLDGADGLWVPEERTVLVSRGLSEAKVAEVIEHELGHVMIDDQHADLDAGRDLLVGRPPTRASRLLAAAATVVAMFAVIGAVAYGLTRATGDPKRDQVAPNPRLSAQESADPTTTVSPSMGRDGKIHYRTITLTATPGAPAPTGSPAGPPRATATATRPGPTPPATVGPTAPEQTTPPAPSQPAPSTIPAPTLTAGPPTTTDPGPTSPAATAGSGGDSGLGDQDTGGTATGAPDASGQADASGVAAVGTGTP